MERQIGDCDTEVIKYEQELDFLRGENREMAVKREHTAITKLQSELAKHERDLKNATKELTTLEKSVDELRTKIAAKKALVDEAEVRYATSRKETHAIDKELNAREKEALLHEQTIRRKASARHALLHECKLNVIALPLLSGSLDRLRVIDASLANEESQNPNGASQSQASTSQQSARSQQTDDSLSTAGLWPNFCVLQAGML